MRSTDRDHEAGLDDMTMLHCWMSPDISGPGGYRSRNRGHVGYEAEVSPDSAKDGSYFRYRGSISVPRFFSVPTR